MTEAIKETADLAPTQLRYDYEQIPAGHRGRVMEAAEMIYAAGRVARKGAIRIGQELREVKKRLGYGQFGEWLRAEFDWSERTAERMISVAQYLEGKSDNLSDLGDSVLYLLAAPSTPDEVRVEVEQAAAEGKTVTVEFAKEAIRKHRPEPVQYAAIWQLEIKVNAWLSEVVGESGVPSPDSVLDNLKIQGTEPLKPGGWMDLLSQWIDAVRPVAQWRKSDLIQALNNVREQRRQAKLQAQARTVYLEPEQSGTFETVAEILPEDNLPGSTSEESETSDEELAAMAEVAAEREEEERERLAIDDKPRVFRRSLEDIPPDLKRYGYDIYQLLPSENPGWWYDSKIGGAGAWDSAERAIELARDDLQRRKSHVAGYIVGYLARDSSGDEFDMALEQATIDHLKEALPSTALSKSRREKIESRLRRLEREQPTTLPPTDEDGFATVPLSTANVFTTGLEQEADDLQAMTPTNLERVGYALPTLPDNPSKEERIAAAQACLELYTAALRGLDICERLTGIYTLTAFRRNLEHQLNDLKLVLIGLVVVAIEKAPAKEEV